MPPSGSCLPWSFTEGWGIVAAGCWERYRVRSLNTMEGASLHFPFQLSSLPVPMHRPGISQCHRQLGEWTVGNRALE